MTRRKRTEGGLNTEKDFLDAALDNLMDSLIVIDSADYTILAANRSFIDADRRNKDTIIGKHCYEVTHHRSTPCSSPDNICPLAETLKTGKHATVEHIHYDAAGNKLYVEVSTIPIMSKAGKIDQVIHLSRNITARKQAEEALRESEETAKRLAQENELIAEIGKIIGSTLDLDAVYERFAEKVRELISFDIITINMVNTRDHTRTVRYHSGTHIKGRKIGDVAPLNGSVTERIVRTRSSLLINIKDSEELLKQYPGIVHTITAGTKSMLATPLLSKGEVIGTLLLRSGKPDAYTEKDLRFIEKVGLQIAGAIANAQLFLERVQAEKELQMEEMQLRTILESTGDGILAVDNAGRVIKANQRFADLWKIPSDLFKKGNDEALLAYVMGQLVAPDAFLKKVQALYASTVVDFDTILFKDGRIIERYSFPLLSEGVINGRVWSFRDITERRQAEEALRESEAKYYDLYENAPDMYYSVDLGTGAIRECNETFLRTTGYRKEELMGRPVFELYDAGSRDEAKKSFQQFPATGEVCNAERRVRCKDGRIIVVSLNVSAIRDKNGNITHSRSIWRDITERKRHEEMIRALAITDQLTGLYNRRGFTPLAEQQLMIAERTGNGIVLLFADMDDLKQINDKLGHRAGDEAIVEVSNVLKVVFRKMDIIARMGGDEFAVLAPEASLEYADMIKNRLQDQINIRNARAGRNYDLSLSIGIAYHDPSTPGSLDELLSRADALMYEQKRRKMP